MPFLQREGWALFADCDIICWSDIAELFALANDQYAVMVAKHEVPDNVGTKMDGQLQTVLRTQELVFGGPLELQSSIE